MDVEFAVDYAVKTFCDRRTTLGDFYLPVNMISVCPLTVSSLFSDLKNLNFDGHIFDMYKVAEVPVFHCKIEYH